MEHPEDHLQQQRDLAEIDAAQQTLEEEAHEPFDTGEGRDDDEAGPGPMAEAPKEIRLLEAMLFAATEPVTQDSLAERMPEGADVPALLQRLARDYAHRGVHLKCIGGRWSFRTAVDLAPHMRIEKKVPRKLSRAAIETLAIICYHQPVTRGEVEEIRGVAVSKGSFDVLLEAGWIRPVGRRRTPGRPATWGTTQGFLEEFGLASLDDLPGIEELKASGLLDTRPASTIVGRSITEMEALAPPADAEEDEELPPLAVGEEGQDEGPIADEPTLGADELSGAEAERDDDLT